MSRTTSIKYVLEGILKLEEKLKKYVAIHSHKDIQWCRKMATKSYVTNNYIKMRIRKITSEVVEEL